MGVDEEGFGGWRVAWFELLKYDINPYTKQVIELLQLRCDSLFGKEKEKQTGLGEFFA